VIAAVACCALLPACSVTDALYTAGGSAAGAAAGAFVGSKASNNPAAPVIGAAGGAAIGGIGTILAINSVKAGQRKQFQQGYDHGDARQGKGRHPRSGRHADLRAFT
jgi:uncharacterized membrane protein YebE (DUF533 family)